MALEKVIFGAGCFWGVEATFRKIKNVNNVTCGYTGGHTNNPTYDDICTGTTGHVEVVQVIYDTNQIDFIRLLDTFWCCHNPTTIDRQGPDIGTQYRSTIFFYTSEQEKIATQSKRELQQKISATNQTIVTEILPASTFYPAEEYHQRYFEKNCIR